MYIKIKVSNSKQNKISKQFINDLRNIWMKYSLNIWSNTGSLIKTLTGKLDPSSKYQVYALFCRLTYSWECRGMSWPFSTCSVEFFFQFLWHGDLDFAINTNRHCFRASTTGIIPGTTTINALLQRSSKKHILKFTDKYKEKVIYLYSVYWLNRFLIYFYISFWYIHINCSFSDYGICIWSMQTTYIFFRIFKFIVTLWIFPFSKFLLSVKTRFLFQILIDLIF